MIFDVMEWVWRTRIGTGLFVLCLLGAVGAAASAWSWMVPAIPAGVIVVVGAVWGIRNQLRGPASDRDS